MYKEDGKVWFNEDYEFWECAGDKSKASYARVLETLVHYEGCITSIFDLFKEHKRGASVFYMIKIPKGKRKEFEQLTKTTLKPPTKVKLN